MNGRDKNRKSSSRQPSTTRPPVAPWEPRQPPGYQRLPEFPEYAEEAPFSESPTQLQHDNRLIDIEDGEGEDANTSAQPYSEVYDTTADYSSESSIEEDVCFPTPTAGPHKESIDYDSLDAAIKQGELGPQSRQSSTGHRYSFYGHRIKHLDQHPMTAKHRITLYSVVDPNSIHGSSFADIKKDNKALGGLMKKGSFWLDIESPTEIEMRALSTAFRIHPLTSEDISMEEQSEKCEVFKNYYFICFRSFEQNRSSADYLQPLAIYIIVFREGVLSFHFRPMPHPHNVRKRIKQLKDYIRVTPDWICYAILDDITDSFAPLIREIEFEVDSIDELVLILKESEQSDMLRRIGYCRKRMMILLRLLVGKVDVVKTLVKRGEAKPEADTRPALSNEVSLYLGDVQDHILTMLQALNHYEKISSRSHSNYLAQISIEMTQTNNDMNDVLSKLTALGSVLVPMNLVTGLWGMNVLVPGQDQDDLTWFMSITVSILVFCILSSLLMRYYHIL